MTCRKRRYRDRVAALLALASTGHRRHVRQLKEERRSYWCRHCRGYHLTSQGKRTGAAR